MENLRWATKQNLNDAFLRFASVLDQRFAATISATHGAIQAAYVKRKEHSEAISDDVSRFEGSSYQVGGDFCRASKVTGPWFDFSVQGVGMILQKIEDSVRSSG